MQTRSHHPHDDIRSIPVMPCAQCGRMLFAPEWSEYVNERKVRHLWVCAACDYDFETIALFPAPARAEGQKQDRAGRPAKTPCGETGSPRAR